MASFSVLLLQIILVGQQVTDITTVLGGRGVGQGGCFFWKQLLLRTGLPLG